QHGLELVGLDAGHDAVFQRGALPGQVVARARVLDEVVQQLAHATRIPPGGARGPARGVHWDRMLRARLGAVLAVLALVAGVAGAAIVLLAGPGSRMGWWTWRTGLGLLADAAYAGVAAGVLGLAAIVVGLLWGGRVLLAVLALLLGLGAFAPPFLFMR